MDIKTDILIAGCGVAGLMCALTLPKDKKILMITKSTVEESDSYLAQGGICVLRDDGDYESYYEDTMRAGHYENNPKSVEIMIRSSSALINRLVDFGVDFESENGEFIYTREGAHSQPRILYHRDITGEEITSKLIAQVRKRDNITIKENFTMTDIIEKDGECVGITGNYNGENVNVSANYTVIATGGIGGLFEHSTNYPHLRGDCSAIALRHNIEVENLHYIQIHPTTLYSKKDTRSFLISESVRGEGAILLDKNMERFTDELQPRDVLTNRIYEQMEKDNTEYVWLSMAPIPKDIILKHFPNIYKRCLDEGYNVTKEPIPIVPAQHYHMGGIKINSNGRTSMKRLYCAGEAACNGVHGKNRLASNSLLESMVFASRAADDISKNYITAPTPSGKDIEKCLYTTDGYKEIILNKISEMQKGN